MKFTIKNETGESITNLMRRARYHFMGRGEESSQLNFVRPLGQNPYPRFHIYLKESEKTNGIFFNLHLDQKKPIYKGAPAHSAEYGGEILEKEVERIRVEMKKPST